jgi:glycosyltransferase involved in cell wall biosynthesis
MRIALVSTMRTAVPPPKTGSVELIVGLLAQELHRRGHEVTVFAPGDSQVPTRLKSILPTGYHHDASIWDWHLAEFMQLGLAYAHAGEFDIIHSHVYCYALPFTRLVKTPTVHTFHICPTPDFIRFCAMYPDQSYVLISDFQREFFQGLPIAGMVHNGIDTGAFPFRAEPGKYLVYLGDFRADKGPLEAIRCARRTGIPIRLAGPDSEYFQSVIKPEVDGRSVVYVGEVDHAGKVALLADAFALLFPLRGLEACPLVLLESLACGTPVLAFRRGPAPELIVEGVGGFLVNDDDELVAAVSRLEQLDRAAVRRRAVEHFNVSRMVDDYLSIYERVIAQNEASTILPKTRSAEK